MIEKALSLLVAGLALVAGVVSAAPQREPAGDPIDPPHIILIMTDQHRGDAVGYAGNPAVITPNLDRLAEEGAYFTRGYSATPSCTPARAALLTGLSPWHHGMLGYGRVAEHYAFEMPQMLRDLGYFTFGIGKMHWAPQRALHGFHGTVLDESGRVEQEGFISDYRRWFMVNAPGEDPDATGIGFNEHRAGVYQLPEALHPTRWTGDTAVRFIENYDQDRPLFLTVSFERPHSPYDPPQRYLDLYDGVDIPPPAVGTWAEAFADYPMTPDAAFGDFGVDHAVRSRRHYYANITFIDDQVGAIVRALKEKGMYDDALILFTADHGDMLGDHHHWRKTYAYEGSARVPFLLRWPEGVDAGIPRGTPLGQPVELRDVLPTFLDAANGAIPGEMDGRSLLDLVRDPHASWRPYIDLEHARTYRDENYWSALTDGRMKYVWFFPTGEEQLFDLEDDPQELTDLSEDPAYRRDLETWRGRMVDHLRERGDGFVRDGRLVVRDEVLLYSPHYPRTEMDEKDRLRAWRRDVSWLYLPLRAP